MASESAQDLCIIDYQALGECLPDLNSIDISRFSDEQLKSFLEITGIIRSDMSDVLARVLLCSGIVRESPVIAEILERRFALLGKQ